MLDPPVSPSATRPACLVAPARPRRAVHALIAALALAAGAAAAEWTEQSQIQLFLENDVLNRTDRYYTNGFKIGFGAPSSDWIDKMAAGMLESVVENGEPIQTGLFVGQNMYTPKNITIAAAQPYDRPWSAWAYVGVVAQRAHRGSSHVDRIDTLEFDVGATGRAAFGEQVQKTVHRWTGSKTPMGWDNQSPGEPAAMVAFLSKWKLGHNEYWDVVSHAGFTVGTVMTLARAGGVARVGFGLSGFGVDTIEPGGAILQSTRTSHLDRKNGGTSTRGRYEGYLFAGVDQRLVAWNTFLDGPVFHEGQHVGRRPHVYDLVGGASVRIGWFRFSMTRVRRSEEFHTAAGGGGGRQFFDSINFGAEW